MPDVLQKLLAQIKTTGKSIDNWLTKLQEETEDQPDKDRAKYLLYLTVVTGDGIAEVTQNDTTKKLLGEDQIQVVELLEGYKRLSQRTIALLLEKSQSGSAKLKELADKAEASLATLYDLLDQVESYNPAIDFDECQQLFLNSLPIEKYPKAYAFTQELFRDHYLPLDLKLDNLLDAWGTGISSFINNAQQTDKTSDTVKFGEPETIVDFLCMHDCLETLYSRLVTNVPNE